MITFITAIAILVLGYFVYGKYVAKVFGVESDRVAPAVRLSDGVDYAVLPLWKVFLIQFLNIAGLGPIFGAIAGATFGPVAFLWIVFGTIFAGAVHDYLSGMISMRHDGLSITEIVGIYLGKRIKHIMTLLAIVLLLLVGAVFMTGPAKIIDGMTSGLIGMWGWVAIILVYYILSTLLPIDKVIGKIYPIFGVALLFMAAGLFVALIFGDYTIPELNSETFTNMKDSAATTPIFPMLFITIACGAISGFHATQSPLMARCLRDERQGRVAFYGAMVSEGIVALIWAAAAMAFFGGVDGLNISIAEQSNNVAGIANQITHSMLGPIGGVLAILGIVAAPITSGDTAFRSARIIIADQLKVNQGPLKNRLYVSIPLFIIAFVMTQVDFSIIWRYFAWSNQTIGVFVLWTVTAYLIKNRRNYYITLIPAMFMTAVCSTYILVAKEGFHIDYNIGLTIGLVITALVTVVFCRKFIR